MFGGFVVGVLLPCLLCYGDFGVFGLAWFRLCCRLIELLLCV